MDWNVLALGSYNDDLVAGDVPAHLIARWDGTSWHPLSDRLDPNGTVRALIVHNDTLYAGGAFFGGVAEWKAGYWFQLGTLFGDVEALVVHGGRCYAGGDTGISPRSSIGVAQWVE